VMRLLVLLMAVGGSLRVESRGAGALLLRLPRKALPVRPQAVPEAAHPGLQLAGRAPAGRRGEGRAGVGVQEGPGAWSWGASWRDDSWRLRGSLTDGPSRPLPNVGTPPGTSPPGHALGRPGVGPGWALPWGRAQGELPPRAGH